MGNTEKLLELSKELVSIKELELNALNERLGSVIESSSDEFIQKDAPAYQHAPKYLMSARNLAVASIRQKIVQVTGELEGAKEQVKELEQELADAKDLTE